MTQDFLTRFAPLLRSVSEAMICGFRSKSATCSGMKSAADSDLKSAVPI